MSLKVHWYQKKVCNLEKAIEHTCPSKYKEAFSGQTICINPESGISPLHKQFLEIFCSVEGFSCPVNPRFLIGGLVFKNFLEASWNVFEPEMSLCVLLLKIIMFTAKF